MHCDQECWRPLQLDLTLGERFVAIVAQRQEPATAREAEQQARLEVLSRQLAELKQSQSTLRMERDKWQASTQTLLRAVQVLRLQNAAMQAEIQLLKRRASASSGRSTSGLYQV
jgi:chromosome segregation ATPase